MSNKRWVKFVPTIIGVFFIVGIIGLGLYLKSVFKTDEKPKKQVQQVTIITPPPPPPPPPPEMKEPEPKDEVVEEAPDEPEPADDVAEADPGEDPAVGEGTDSGIPMGRKGRVGFGGAGSAYEQTVRSEINEFILQHDRLRYLDYVAVVTLWIDENGMFERFDIQLKSGDEETRSILETALNEMGKISYNRPIESAEKITLRIKSVI